MTSGSEQFRQTFRNYLELVQRVGRHRNLIFGFFFLGTILSVVAANLISPVFESSTVILVQQQNMPAAYFSSPISVDLEKRLRTVAAQIMSRARLEQVIRKLNLYDDLQNDPKGMEMKVERMRKAITVSVKGEDTFKLSFRSRSPDIAKHTTEELARLFISENLSDRSQQAMNATQILDDEIGKLKQKLEVQETHLQKRRSRRLAFLQRNRAAVDRGRSDSLGKAEVGPSLLDQLKMELAQKKTQFTEMHPDVRELKRQVAELESSMKASQQEAPPAPPQNEETARMAQVEEAKTDEAAFRDYESLKASYEALLKKQFDAQLSISLEQKQKTDAYKILDPAYLPMIPIWPKVGLIILFGSVFSLGLGLAGAFLRETLDSTIRGENDLKKVAQLSILTVIPPLLVDDEWRGRRLERKAS
jgi:polysaccharide biosynthesis transport protein